MKALLLRLEKINNRLKRHGIDSFKNLTQDMDTLTTKLLSYQLLFYPSKEAKE